MHVKELELVHYRNLPYLKLDNFADLHLFIGENAQGKTNILESLYLLALGKSHRTRSHKELIQWEQPFAKISSRIVQQDYIQRLEVQFNAKGKKVIKNGIEQKRMSDYIGTLTAVMFAPEDLAIVKGSPQVRRRFLDMELGQISPSYVYDLTQYNKVIIQRNSLLKELAFKGKTETTLLDVLDQQMAELAVRLWKKRYLFVDKLASWAEEIHYLITQGKEQLEIVYQPSFLLKAEEPSSWYDKVMAELNRVRAHEVRKGSTSFGPHRDDLCLFSNGTNLHHYGSQGQQRTAALSLKLAELELIHEQTGSYPILLLDDVLSELDDLRRTHLLEAIRGKVQTFVTSTSTEGIDRETLAHAQIYQVVQGKVSLFSS
ncbi:DNA replication/repair protein RecF [Mechercharimyces sp. CAU 1602]|uniref:DNA replication/repair protein RecF n=1 Tax=Mechercharimyces sp. CAU 1602 TaxID=2973933 RepID=UPI0021625273|nr:DNA replication/repair protein RecF [Mechercharimyces sp. CAU 1602]MCS1352702.1 DNA replication/repair protein RecF [Mechercharimyces sp. CAU 1602]